MIMIWFQWLSGRAGPHVEPLVVDPFRHAPQGLHTGCPIIIARSAVIAYINRQGKNYGKPCKFFFLQMQSISLNDPFFMTQSLCSSVGRSFCPPVTSPHLAPLYSQKEGIYTIYLSSFLRIYNIQRVSPTFSLCVCLCVCASVCGMVCRECCM